MNKNSLPLHEQDLHFVDLLIQRSTLGLAEFEHLELLDLASRYENQNELERFDLTVTAVDHALSSGRQEALPPAVRDRLLISAGRFFGSVPATPASMSIEKDIADEMSSIELPKSNQRPPSIRWREIIALAVMAAGLLLILSVFNPFTSTRGAHVASVAQRMDRFIASNPTDLLDLQWQPVHVQTAGGKVLWSDSAQEGYMVFSGMEVNDPQVEQYQLWIFDTDPAQATPIDGGVFNITQSNRMDDGKVVVPIKQTVPVDRAVQFAVTVEKPGGVYVSKREKIPVLAKIAGLD